MARPKLFRDPVHGQIRFEDVDLRQPAPTGGGWSKRGSWLLRKLIDTKEFQRLRFIRQNGLANFVFHGAEHSRFSHSMGVAYLAHEMHDRIVRNMGEQPDEQWELSLGAASLLHDVGHGPFSHTLEEILKDNNVSFSHETMTKRIIEEDTSETHKILAQVDPGLPGILVAYIDKAKRKSDHWAYKVVSSQLDADRLDYLRRDAKFAGLEGHGFDLPRLIDMLHHLDGSRIAVHRRATEAAEAYLIALDQMYRAVYFHHTIRAASFLLSACLGRAFQLHNEGNKRIFGSTRAVTTNPLCDLFKEGERVSLEQYLRLGEHQIWTLVDEWRLSNDKILSDLSNRLLSRNFYKTMDVDPSAFSKLENVKKKAQELVKKTFPYVKNDTARYYISVDEPSRTSYKRYDWRRETPDESIWMISSDRPPCTIEDEQQTKLVSALKDTKYFHRLIFPAEIRQELDDHK